MAMGYISGSWSNVIAFVVMLVVVLIKPQGLFGSKIWKRWRSSHL